MQVKLQGKSTWRRKKTVKPPLPSDVQRFRSLLEVLFGDLGYSRNIPEEQLVKDYPQPEQKSTSSAFCEQWCFSPCGNCVPTECNIYC